MIDEIVNLVFALVGLVILVILAIRISWEEIIK